MLQRFNTYELQTEISRSTDSQALLFYLPADIAVASLVAAGADITDAAQSWLAHATKLLDIIREHRYRIMLFNAVEVLDAPDDFRNLCATRMKLRKLDAPIGKVSFLAPDPVFLIASQRYLAHRRDYAHAQAELEARSQPIGNKGLRVSDDSETAKKVVSYHHQNLTRFTNAREEAQSKLQPDIDLLRSQLKTTQMLSEVYFQRHEDAKREIMFLSKDIETHKTSLEAIKSSLSWRLSAPVRLLGKIGRRLRRTPLSGMKDAYRIRSSSWFDAQWYREMYPDIRELKADPAVHYLRHGAAEGRNPGPRFSTRDYLLANPDVAATGANPLLHYILHGEAEGRNINPT